jgi:hypothetical protein
MRRLSTIRNQFWAIPHRLPVRGLAIAASVSLAAALLLSSCEVVATYPQRTAVRVIDASYIAPAANFTVNGQPLATNVGSGLITAYGTLSPSASAAIGMTAVTGGPALLTASAPLQAGNQYSIFLSDSVGTATAYLISVLQDQGLQAPAGQAEFRFLNQAESTGAVDIYMVPAGASLANAAPLVTDLPVGGPISYIGFQAQTVTMIVTPTGLITPAYTSNPIPLIGGEVRTVLIMDAKLTANPPVAVTMADDAGPAN